MTTPEAKAPPPMIWWIVWGAITVGLVVVYALLRPTGAKQLPDGLRFVPIMPWCASALVRWLVLPRFSGARAFPLYIIGIALAEGCGILGIFLVPDMRDEYLALALVGLAQFFPLFILREKRG